MGAGNFIGRAKGYFTGESLRTETGEPQFLPPSVRMTLGHQNDQLGVHHIEHLMDARLQRLAFYLLMKATEDNNPLQMGLLQRLSKLDYDFSEFSDEDARPALEHLAQQDKPTVQGGKLAQVSRHGFKEWPELFDRTLRRELEDEPDAVLFMLANAPYIGFDKLAHHSLQKGAPLGILRPERFMEPTNPDTSVGYLLTPVPWGISIAELFPDFERPEDVIIFDDVIKSGHVRVMTRAFWTQDGENTPPGFISAIKADGAV